MSEVSGVSGVRKPRRLNRGDKVGIVVPASPVKKPFRNCGLGRIREMGYEPVEAEHILSQDDFLAKTPGESFEDLRLFLNDGDIKAVWAARGGYGSNYLLPLLMKLTVKEPKIVIGSSDISYLLWYLLDNFRMVVFYGPMAYSSLPENRFDAANFEKIFTGAYGELKIPGGVLVPGSARGIVTGGCLSNFVSLIGTRYLPEVDRRILLLEDVGERPYRLDRMFWQAAEAGVFSKLRGLVLGEFPGCFKDGKEKENFLKRILYYLKDFNIPVIYDLPFGHSENIHTLPLGIEVEIDTPNFPGLLIKEKGVS
ncbi:MAG: LD-carboxypeptidase [bacterium]|nr:LD-carboxypeptidase [bacterium]